jgi:SAM-dependent methyltransferase
VNNQRPPDWQLPPGVTPGLWEYLHDPILAQQYLGKVSDSPFAQADQRFVQKHLPIPCTVIDLGCGPGRSLLPLYQRGFHYTGVDLSEHMLEEARKFLLPVSVNSPPLPNLFQANLGAPLPFDKHTFDAALCLFGTLGMLHPENIRQNFLAEVKRILKPTGKFLVHVHNRWPLQGIATMFKSNSVVTLPVHQGISNLQMKLYTEPEIRNTLEEAGLMVQELEYIDAKHPQGQYTGSRWFAPYRAAGFLLAALPKP